MEFAALCSASFLSKEDRKSYLKAMSAQPVRKPATPRWPRKPR